MAWFFPSIRARLFFKINGCKLGANFRVCGKFYFRTNRPGDIIIGDNVTIIARFLSNAVGITSPAMLDCMKWGQIIIGDNTGITSTIISSRKCIKIGNNVNVGANCRIFDHDFHSLNHIHRRNSSVDIENIKMAAVNIEDDVFIGTNSTILKGVNIGARTIVAAGSVVTIKNIPPDSIVGGNPAKIIKTKSN